MKGNESNIKGNESRMKGTESTVICTGTGTDGHGYSEIMSNFVETSQPAALVLARCNDIRRTVIVLVHMQMLPCPYSASHVPCLCPCLTGYLTVCLFFFCFAFFNFHILLFLCLFLSFLFNYFFYWFCF